MPSSSCEATHIVPSWKNRSVGFSLTSNVDIVGTKIGASEFAGLVVETSWTLIGIGPRPGCSTATFGVDSGSGTTIGVVISMRLSG